MERGESSPSRFAGAGDLPPSNRPGVFPRRWTQLWFADESANLKSGDKSPHSKSLSPVRELHHGSTDW